MPIRTDSPNIGLQRLSQSQNPADSELFLDLCVFPGLPHSGVIIFFSFPQRHPQGRSQVIPIYFECCGAFLLLKA